MNQSNNTIRSSGQPTKRIKAKDVFRSHILEKYKPQLLVLLQSRNYGQHIPFEFNFSQLMLDHVEVAEALISRPERLLPILKKSLLEAQELLVQENSALNLSVNENIHPRLTGVPSAASSTVPKASDISSLLCFSGTVVKSTVPRLLRHTTQYVCDLCHHVMEVKSDHDEYYRLNKPSRCSNSQINCFSRQFSSNSEPDLKNTTDYQEIKLQELSCSGDISRHSMPQSVWVTLHDDLVDLCKPGDDVLVCGSVVRRWKQGYKDTRPAIEIAIRANNVTVRNKQDGGSGVTVEQEKEFLDFWERYKYSPLTGRDIILASICPQMYGLFLVKLSVAIVMCGGVQRVDQSATRVRGEAHLLLVGDPGTGKSQLLSWANHCSSRSVLTTGIGSSAAGLTVTAVKESGGDWALEAGALVLADGGLCCIDEFSSIKETDRGAIHEAMEQQTISVAKAGMVCKLNSRCSVMAATNPKGRYDPSLPVNLNVGIATPLLSRFDLILVLRDINNPDWDKLVSSYILFGGAPSFTSFGDGGKRSRTSCENSSLWSMDKMRAYIHYIKRLKPKLDADANAILSKFYQLQRNNSQRDLSRTTIRLLESLVRLSQGHARLMLRNKVTAEDAVIAVTLWSAAMREGGENELFFSHHTKNKHSTLHAAFPADPTEDYREKASEVLQMLNLSDIWYKELARINELERLSTMSAADFTVPTQPIVVSSDNLEAESTRLHDKRPSFSTFLATQDIRRTGIIEELVTDEGNTQSRVKRKKGKGKGEKGKKFPVKKVNCITDYLNSEDQCESSKRLARRFALSSDSSSDEGEEGTSMQETEETPAKPNKATHDTNNRKSQTLCQKIKEKVDVDKENKRKNDRVSGDAEYCLNTIVKKRKLAKSDKSKGGSTPSKNTNSERNSNRETLPNVPNVNQNNINLTRKRKDGGLPESATSFDNIVSVDNNSVINNSPIEETSKLGLTQKAKSILSKFAFNKSDGKPKISHIDDKNKLETSEMLSDDEPIFPLRLNSTEIGESSSRSLNKRNNILGTDNNKEKSAKSLSAKFNKFAFIEQSQLDNSEPSSSVSSNRSVIIGKKPKDISSENFPPKKTIDRSILIQFGLDEDFSPSPDTSNAVKQPDNQGTSNALHTPKRSCFQLEKPTKSSPPSSRASHLSSQGFNKFFSSQEFDDFDF